MAPRHDRNAPHGRIQGAPPPATILGKSPKKKPGETSANLKSVLREIARGGEPVSVFSMQQNDLYQIFVYGNNRDWKSRVLGKH